MKISVVPAAGLSAEQRRLWTQIQSENPLLANPSFCPEFTLAAAKARQDVEVAILEDGNTCAGFFPFQREAQTIGYPVASVLSSKHGLIASGALPLDPVDLLNACGLQCWHFDHLVAGQEMFIPHHRLLDPSPYMDLSNGYASYLEERAQAGSKVGKAAQRKARKLEREVGPLRFELHSPEPGALERLIQLKREQVVAQGFVDLLEARWARHFLGALANTRTERFQGLVSELYAGDKVVAAMMGLKSRGTIDAWIPTFDPAYARYSPGLILHLKLAEQAAADGVTYIDLGTGENQMKTSLMSGAFPVALGSVDRRPLHRAMTGAWYGLRGVAHSRYMAGWPRATAQRLNSALKSYRLRRKSA